MPFYTGGVNLNDFFFNDADIVEQFVNGTLWAWGGGITTSGRLGDNTNTNRSSPVQTITGGTNWKQSSCGYRHTAAVKNDGTLWCWGSNTNGILGDNTTVARSSPVQTITVGTNWKQVACGYRHTAAVKNDGTLWCWGLNTEGRLGDNTTVTKSSPVQTITVGTNWKQVACGAIHTAAVKNDGTLWCWGSNANGRLGDNTAVSKSSPVQTIAGGTNWKQVAGGYSHTAAIKTDGTLWLWGRNNRGQLGDNTLTDKSSPVQTITGGTNWKQVACGAEHTAAVKNDGTLWLWGRNTEGRLGDNTITGRSSPVQTIAGGTNWKQVACGGHYALAALFTAAIKADGTLWLWGGNAYGQLGNNTITGRSSPVQAIAGGTNWKQVSCGYTHAAAVQNNG